MTENFTMHCGTGIYVISGQSVQFTGVQNYAAIPGSPFYGFIVTYFAASAGLTPVYDQVNYPDFLKGRDGLFPGNVAITANVNLGESVQSARRMLQQQQAEIYLCCMLANSCYESVHGLADDARRQALNQIPEFRFLKHVRDASSHGNTFTFRGEEPKFPAHWRSIVLDHTKKGATNEFNGKPCHYGVIAPSDLLELLRDVEQLLAGASANGP